MEKLYEEVTNNIIADLEKGIIPWVKPWKGGGFAIPKNALTNRHYSGINILILWNAAEKKGYVNPLWLTFRQAKELGGTVRKGEKGTLACHADKFIPKDEQERAALEGDEAKAIPFMKQFVLFNVAQCEGLPEHLTAARTEENKEDLTLPLVDALVAATKADIRFQQGGRAFYSFGQDYVQMPLKSDFYNTIDFYPVIMHELAHWTGHNSRLNRVFGKRFGDETYAAEELVAEMASAFLCAIYAIQPTIRHADYIGSWLKILKGDNRAIFTAASLASKASDYLLSLQA